MTVRIVIHNPGDTIYTMAKTGVIRAFVVNPGGIVEPQDMGVALDKEEEVDLRGGTD